MKYDLGQKYDDMPCAPASSGDSKEKVHYPTLYFTHDEKIDFPEEGEAVIKFRKVESAENTRDPEDPKYRCELEVHSIEPKGGKRKEEGMVSVADAMKKALGKARQVEVEVEEYED